MSGLDELLICDRKKLVMRWRRAFASSPPKHTSTLLLQKVLTHHLQCKGEGDIPTRTRTVLKHALKVRNRMQKAANENSQSASGGPAAGKQYPTYSGVALSAGVQLVREWNGRIWQVEVLEDGFICNGKTYRSLSAIARMITGTRWSGPRFFGLTP